MSTNLSALVGCNVYIEVRGPASWSNLATEPGDGGLGALVSYFYGEFASQISLHCPLLPPFHVP